MVHGIRNLAELSRKGGAVQATCRKCGRVAVFAVNDLASHFALKGWNGDWPGFAHKLRCSGAGGCGSRSPAVAWLVDPPPAAQDASPPRPRLVRAPARPPAGISQADWELAKTDRERRRLIRIARD